MGLLCTAKQEKESPCARFSSLRHDLDPKRLYL